MFTSAVILSTYIAFTKAGVTCIQQTGPLSATGDDATSQVTCPADYELVACGIQARLVSSAGEIDGSYISGDTCIAQNGAGGGGVYAKAQCCKFTDLSGTVQDLTCANRRSGQTGSGDDATATVGCLPGEQLFGCTVQTDHKGMDGGLYSNAARQTNSDLCTANNGASTSGDFAWARCCQDLPGEEFECRVEGGSAAGPDVPGSGLTSVATCNDDEFVAGCVGIGFWKNIASWFVDGQECKAINSGVRSVWAKAQCCKAGPSLDCGLRLVKTPSDYMSAEAVCGADGLAVINSAEQCECAKQLMAGEGQAWTGLNALSNGGGFFEYENALCPQAENGRNSGACLGKKCWVGGKPLCEKEEGGSQCAAMSAGGLTNAPACDAPLNVLCNDNSI